MERPDGFSDSVAGRMVSRTTFLTRFSPPSPQWVPSASCRQLETSRQSPPLPSSDHVPSPCRPRHRGYLACCPNLCPFSPVSSGVRLLLCTFLKARCLVISCFLFHRGEPSHFELAHSRQTSTERDIRSIESLMRLEYREAFLLLR
jgi:hypothetical protein